MPTQPVLIPTTMNDRDHSACGVGMIVTIPPVVEGPLAPRMKSHQIVLDGLEVLANFDYRSGFNPATEESDGAGIRLDGLPTAFFNKIICAHEFISPTNGMPLDLILKDNQFGIGHYFLSNLPDEMTRAKRLIEDSARTHGLMLMGWRDVQTTGINTQVLSKKSREKIPGIWQAILIKTPEDLGLDKPIDIETAIRKTIITLSNHARDTATPIHIVSQSSQSIVYKGMVPPTLMAQVYLDLTDEDFKASAIAVHARFATNTEPQWENAQPCPNFIGHNGEFNSAPANATEMRQAFSESLIQGIDPIQTLSDSMQFDTDLLNQVMTKNISLAEALVRLMPPPASHEDNEEVRAMLHCFRNERAPYNGPGLIIASCDGYYIAKLDECGLRPSRWGLVQLADGSHQFHAASDDYLIAPPGGQIIEKGQLDRGGMIMVTPQGNIYGTRDILKQISESYHKEHHHYFQTLYKATTCLLKPEGQEPSIYPQNQTELNRILYAAGWDHETVMQVLCPLAEKGIDPTAAMGDDTNPLYATQLPPHISYFFHQLFAQVSAPPIDSIRDRDLFTIQTSLGPRLGAVANARQIALDSPILGADELFYVEHHPQLRSIVLDLSFSLPESEAVSSTENRGVFISEAIKKVLHRADSALADTVDILILSDRDTDANRASIPDLIMVAALRQHLDNINQSRKVSMIVDSYQLSGPHQAAALLALGANAVYARGAYEKINDLYAEAPQIKQSNYQHALEKSLLKTMGKMGITDVNNYINGKFMAALGLDLTPELQTLEEQPTLSSIFRNLYSPLKGIHLGHVANETLRRHLFAHDPEQVFSIMPRSGYYMPEKNGIKHGYGPVVVNAFTEWRKAEEIRVELWQMDRILKRRNCPDFIADRSIFTSDQGFLDPRNKDNGLYLLAYLEQHKVSPSFLAMSKVVEQYKRKHPTAIRDYFSIKKLPQERIKTLLGLLDSTPVTIQTKADILASLFSGSMSQGALTPKAHEMLTRGVNAVHAMSGSGEGGEAPKDLRDFSSSTRSKQIASGRFGVSAMQILAAKEIEIKVAQGAKPGEGGELPGIKVSIRFAAQRGGLPGTPFISPPPHHDIYSIEDLEQLIVDIKAVNPAVSVAVKLVASAGIGTIACGVAKAGADVINIASNSGGTAAAQQSSIKHAGLPGEIGLAEVDKALRKAGLRDLVLLRTSGGLKTADDILLSAILGADQFELGTTSMLLLGCEMQRTCDKSCQPGVATDGHLFKGNQMNVERYFVNLAADVQARLSELSVPSLKALRGHTALLEVCDPDIKHRYDFSAIVDRPGAIGTLSVDAIGAIRALRYQRFKHDKEDALIPIITQYFQANPGAIFSSETIHLTPQERSFGARIAGAFVTYLEAHHDAKIILNTSGIAGQSLGFVMPKGMDIRHTGTAQDGCGKSMSGGILALTAPHQVGPNNNTITGNALLYGASGGKAFVSGIAGHRCGILLKGAEVVIEGAGDRAFQYMTSGTAMILGKVGLGLCSGAQGGIVFIYAKDNRDLTPSSDARCASDDEASVYSTAIQEMLQAHANATGSIKAQEILSTFDVTQFNVLIPRAMDNINTLQQVLNVLETYQLRLAPLTPGMQVWLEQKIERLLNDAVSSTEEQQAFLNSILSHEPDKPLTKLSFLSVMAQAKLTLWADNRPPLEKRIDRPEHAPKTYEVKIHPKTTRKVRERIGDIKGELDELLRDAINHLNDYVNELTHDATGCSGCRKNSCAGGEEVDTGCPSGKAINTINATLKKIGIIDKKMTQTQWRLLREAFEFQIQASPFIAYTGAACPAPCQDACTETIPTAGAIDTYKAGKRVGEAVHIKDIEFYLYQIGRALGWFDGKKEWLEEEIQAIFGSSDRKRFTYDLAMRAFKAPFGAAKIVGAQSLIIVGSGPSAMQIAFEALKDGVTVQMFEASDKPGGLLVDGIPAHKFDKRYIDEDFARLINMGLKLHLNSKVIYDNGEYKVNGQVIASRHNEHQHIALCVGAGLPKDLPSSVAATLDKTANSKIVQATDFLKIANDVAAILINNPSLEPLDRERLIKEKFGAMDPRGKKIVVIGGGDTAQDVIRWVARYFNDNTEGPNQLEVLVRGPQYARRGMQDAYPSASLAPTKENKLRDEEVAFINGHASHLVQPKQIVVDSATGQLTVHITESYFKYYSEIQKDKAGLQASFEGLPREKRPIDPTLTKERVIDKVDMVICALGFQGENSIPLINAIKEANAPRVYIAGDAADNTTKIIVSAQASGKDTYIKKIRLAMGLLKERDSSGLLDFTMFSQSTQHSKPQAQASEYTP